MIFGVRSMNVNVTLGLISQKPMLNKRHMFGKKHGLYLFPWKVLAKWHSKLYDLSHFVLSSRKCILESFRFGSTATVHRKYDENILKFLISNGSFLQFRFHIIWKDAGRRKKKKKQKRDNDQIDIIITRIVKQFNRYA